MRHSGDNNDTMQCESCETTHSAPSKGHITLFNTVVVSDVKIRLFLVYIGYAIVEATGFIVRLEPHA